MEMEELLAQMRNGDEIAWMTFEARYRNLIFCIGRRNGLNEADCQELEQEVLCAILKQIQTFRYDAERGSFASYLAIIVKRQAMTIWRRHYRRREVCGEELPELPAEDEHEKQQREEWNHALLLRALQMLKAHRDARSVQVFLALTLKECSISKLCAEFRLSADAIYQLKSRCLGDLRKIGRVLKADCRQLQNTHAATLD